MARTYNPNATIPVSVVTLATPLSSKQRILFTTRYDVEGYYSVVKNSSNTSSAANTTKDLANQPNQDKQTKVKETAEELGRQSTKLEWAIKHISVTLLRDWGTSHALISLVANLPSVDTPIPPLPRVDDIRGGNYPYLTCEDEIRIYAGYIDSPLTPITADMLDEIPIRVNDTFAPTPSKPLVPIFWGFIDKIDFDGSAKSTGISYVLSCRDRTRIFADTRIISIPSLGGVLNGKERSSEANANGAPWMIVRDTAKATVGYSQALGTSQQQYCWKPIICPKDPDSGQVEFYSAFEIDNSSRVGSPISKAIEEVRANQIAEDTVDPTIWLRRATHKLLDIQSRPRFHMWLQRPPLAKEAGTSQWQVLDKSPMEIIRWISNMEERPMDFFSSHINGDFVLGPRLLDTSGFYDPDRAYRTYFFRTWPKKDSSGRDIPTPCINQLIISLKSFTTSIATFNRFVVIDSSETSGVEASVLSDVSVTIDSIPWLFDGDINSPRTPSVPCRTKIIYDGNLSNYQNASGGALLSAISASKTWGRDVNGVLISVIGDPTWYPSEAMRIYNSVLHDVGVRTEIGTAISNANREIALEETSDKYSVSSAPHVSNSENPADSLRSHPENNKINSDLNLKGTQVTNKDELILPVYKVRSVEHKILTQGSKAGFTTTIAAVSDL